MYSINQGVQLERVIRRSKSETLAHLHMLQIAAEPLVYKKEHDKTMVILSHSLSPDGGRGRKLESELTVVVIVAVEAVNVTSVVTIAVGVMETALWQCLRQLCFSQSKILLRHIRHFQKRSERLRLPIRTGLPDNSRGCRESTSGRVGKSLGDGVQYRRSFRHGSRDNCVVTDRGVRADSTCCGRKGCG